MAARGGWIDARRARGSRLAAGAALLALCSPARGAAPARVPSLEEILGRPAIEGDRPTQATPSPDGAWIAFVWNAAGERSPRDLWIADAAGGSPPRNLSRLTDPTEQEPRSARPWKRRQGEPARRLAVSGLDWAPGSDSIVFAAGGDLWLAPLAGGLRRLTDTEAAEGSPRVSPDGRKVLFESAGDLWLLALDGPGGVVQLTRHDEHESLGGASWSPEGGWIAAVRTDEKDRFDLVIPEWLGEKVEPAKVRGGPAPETAVLVAESGGAPIPIDLGPDPPARIVRLAFADDGARILVDHVSRDTKTRRVSVSDLAPDGPGPARVVWEERDPAWAYTSDWLLAGEPSTAFSPDGSRVLVLSERAGYATPWVVPALGGDARPVGPGDFETTWAAWASDDALVASDARDGTRGRRLWLVAVGDGSARALSEPGGLVATPRLARGRGLVAFTRSRLDEPGEIEAVALPAGGVRRLTRSVPAGFSRTGWVVPRFVGLRSADGTPLSAMVYEPDGPVPPGGRPAVVFVHGAGYLQDVLDGWSIYAPNFKFHTRLVRRGYVVLEVDYRGSAGYGREFRTAVHGHLGGKDLEDVAAAARWLRARPDVGRVGIYGGSYGGFLALMAMFREGDLFDAGAALRFVADWRSYHRANPWYCEQRLGSPEDEPEAYRQSSPIHHAEGLEGPLLLLHGMRDSNVHVQDAVRLTARLIELGKRFELMLYPAENHGFDEPASWIDEYRRIEELFDRELAGAGRKRRRAPAAAQSPR